MITKEPLSFNNCFQNRIYFESAREGFASILESLSNEKEIKILLPAYIGITDTEGSGVFDPVISTNTKYTFYKLNRDLSIEKESFLEILENDSDINVILVVHYFGFIQNDMEWLSNVVRRFNLLLIEDCAHALHGSTFNGIELGSFGDYSLFSIHKILPTNDGGFIKISPANKLTHKEHTISLSTLVNYSNADFLCINQKRRDNYNLYIKNGLSSIRNIELLYPILPDSVVPLNFPILVKEGLREKLYFILIDKNVITISLYYRLIEQIKESIYPISHYISNSILNLPVHQDTTENDIISIVDALKESFEELAN